MAVILEMSRLSADAAEQGMSPFEQLLKDTGLSPFDVEPDGNCQFHGLLAGVEVLGGRVPREVRGLRARRTTCSTGFSYESKGTKRT